MTLVVRDEDDILETNLRYHLAQGVDFIYALDHNSVDGTPDILRTFEGMGVLRMLREAGEVHDQAPRVTRLARLAHDELGADWVINNDADEFWWPAVGDLKDLLLAIPATFDVLMARRHNFIPRPCADAPFPNRMIWRHAESLTPTGQRLEPKAAHRGHSGIVVAPGNHDIEAPPPAPLRRPPLIEVLHFPARTYEQFVRKTLNTGRGYELLPGRPATVGVDQLHLLDLYRRGELREYFDRWAMSDADLERHHRDGTAVRDVRVRDFLRRLDLEAEGAAHDRRQVHDVVATAALLDGELGAARAAAERLAIEKAELARDHAAAQAALADREAELARLRSALDVVRNSRLMRSTRRLRRIYYALK